ncbi:hypothetical protein EI545_05290 [Tabrizicola piscis]|uniref:Uncharacterized protein n=1 Tax=Tabrizicola piscis TaxID=2494374 RepID=A0A3S8U3W2_9RHOB|nr:hypothetical protein [Tabrizicola piscis]AZL58303.1 hypothetical protein EI545_05290 [Tabrizicola piscis]
MSESLPIEAAAILAQVQLIARRELGLRVAEILKAKWGKAWLETLNRKVSVYAEEKNSDGTKKFMTVEFSDQGFNCDHNKTMIILQQLARAGEFRESNSTIRNLTFSRINSRNRTTHEQHLPPSREQVLADVKETITLLDILGSRSGVSKLKTLEKLISSEDELIITINKAMDAGATPGALPSEMGTILTMMQELLSHAKQAPPKLSTTDKDEIRGLVAEAVQSQLASRPQSIQPAPMLNGRRRHAIPSPAKGVVLFPIVSALSDDESDYGVISTSTYSSPTGRITFASTFSGVERNNGYHQIIADARHHELDGSRTEQSTRARIDPSDFGGNSFGLAAAIADKTARYGVAEGLAGRHIVATGILERDGQGTVIQVDEFQAKVRLLVRSAPSGSFFIFPKENLDASDAQTRELLDQVQFEWRAVTHVDELHDIFAAGADPLLVDERTRPQVLKSVGDEVVDTNEDADPSSSGVAVRHSRRPALAAAVVAGAVLLGGAFAVSEW